MAFPNPSIRRKLNGLDGISLHLSDKLTTLLNGESVHDHVSNLSIQEAQELAEELHGILDALSQQSPAFPECISALICICRFHRMLPRAFVLSAIDFDHSPHRIAPGAIADTYQGTHNGVKICCKQAWTYSTPSYENDWLQKAYQAAILWMYMRHPNIVPFLGATITPLQLASKWMPGGNLMEYLKAHPDTNRLGLLSEVSDALSYLHSLNIAYGGLKGSSILIDDSGRACLADFDLATIVTGLEPTRPDRKFCAIRWTAPEVLGGEAGISKETDIYSFAMVMVEVFSGEPPFPGCTPTSVMTKILLGERPGRPNYPTLTDELWVLTQQCWQENPRRRPEITDVVCCLQRALVIYQDRPSASVTNPKTQTVVKALRRAFGRIWRSPHGHELTFPEASDGVHQASRAPRNWLQRARTWLQNLGSSLPYDSRERSQSHRTGKRSPLLQTYTKEGQSTSEDAE